LIKAADYKGYLIKLAILPEKIHHLILLRVYYNGMYGVDTYWKSINACSFD